MRRLIIPLLFLSLSNHVFGQETAPSNLASRNSVYVELMGNSALYSLNFDRILFSSESFGVAGRVGISYLPAIGAWSNFLVGVPIEVTGLFGRRNSKLELGIGGNYIHLVERSSGNYSVSIEGPDKFSLLAFTPRIGYRLQKNQGGLFIKTGFTPWIFINIDNDIDEIEPNFAPMIGFAIGYTFKNNSIR